MTNKQMIFVTLIFNFAMSGFVMAETSNNSRNKVLDKGWWNGINGEHFTSVIHGITNPKHNINNFPVIIKNRRGELELAGIMGDYRGQKPNPDSKVKVSQEADELSKAIDNNYGVNCDDRFVIVYSDQLSDCEKVVKKLHKELESTEEGLEILKNRHKRLTEFFAATMNDNDNNEEENQE